VPAEGEAGYAREGLSCSRLGFAVIPVSRSDGQPGLSVSSFAFGQDLSKPTVDCSCNYRYFVYIRTSEGELSNHSGFLHSFHFNLFNSFHPQTLKPEYVPRTTGLPSIIFSVNHLALFPALSPLTETDEICLAQHQLHITTSPHHHITGTNSNPLLSRGRTTGTGIEKIEILNPGTNCQSHHLFSEDKSCVRDVPVSAWHGL
jgi:hypothetical protein